MITSTGDVNVQVTAQSVRFVDDVMVVSLSDGRSVSVPLGQIKWLDWLAKATPEQRQNWALEPGGYAIYWEDLDDGFEIVHLLSIHPLI